MFIAVLGWQKYDEAVRNASWLMFIVQRVPCRKASVAWWRHQKETFSASLAFVWGIHRSLVNSTHKGQWCGALMFSLTWAWINGRVNNSEYYDGKTADTQPRKYENNGKGRYSCLVVDINHTTQVSIFPIFHIYRGFVILKVLWKYLYDSTPCRRRRHARRTGCFGYTRVGSISPMQDLTVWLPSCVISENSRSLAAIFFSDGNTRHCSRVYISRDLIWIKIVVGKTIYKQIMIILAIRFAVLSTVFQWK